MKLKITIDMDNAAFETDPAHELARIMTKLAKEYGDWGIVGIWGSPNAILRDINGNLVGTARIN